MKRFALGALLVSAWFAAPGAAAADRAVEPLFGIRVRQEYLPNAYYFDPAENDRNWVRCRTRAGLRWRASAAHTVEVRLANEFRKTYEPDTKVDFDEVVIDRLLWRWRKGGERPWTLTLGRQEIVWNEGFLVLEARPFDGSRTLCQNALRFEKDFEERRLDVALIANPKEDPIVVAGDEERALSDGEERGLAARIFTDEGDQAALIVKREEDPDGVLPVFTSYTAGLRRSREEKGITRWLGEVAFQHQIAGGDAGFAWAGHAARGASLGGKTSAAFGFYYYSGEGRGMKGFRSPWGRWPKWSEMWVYSLIPEGGAAEWRNLASPYVEVRREISRKAAFRGAIHVPWAPAEHWKDRGLLAIAGGTARIAPRLTGHLLWEWHLRGQYPAAFEESAHFLRWQFSYDFL